MPVSGSTYAISSTYRRVMMSPSRAQWESMLRIAVIIIAVHGGHIPPAVLLELGQISLQHGQVVQGKVTHAVELGNVRQQAVLRAFHVAQP